jgi:thioredoxin 1
VTDGTFQSEVLDAEQPVLVDFWAPWCGPCRVVHPILEEMAAERDDLHIVSLNTDENQQTAAQYEVLSIPTLILFKDGAEAKRVIGAMPKRRLESELEPALAKPELTGRPLVQRAAQEDVEVVAGVAGGERSQRCERDEPPVRRGRRLLVVR